MGVSASAIARVTGVQFTYKNFNPGRASYLPQRLAIIGQGNDASNYDTSKLEVSSLAEVGEKYGYGSPLYLCVKQLMPLTGTAAEFPVTVYPVTKAKNSVAATGSITVTGTATETSSGYVKIGGIKASFAVAKGDVAATVMGAIKDAINAVIDMPATAGDVATTLPLTSKWSGAIGNRIKVVISAQISGLTFASANFSSGSLDPSITAALKLIGNVWETFILDTFDYTNTDNLDEYQSFGEDRWSALEKKPLLVAHGCTDDLDTRTAVTNIRPKDKINFLIEDVGSTALPFVVAAKGLINDIMTTANDNPACGYHGDLTGIDAGDDNAQENYTQRNSSVNKGASTNIKVGSVAELCDIVTFWHPDTEGEIKSCRYVADMVKLMNVCYNVRLIMEADEIKGAPLIPDTTVTDNPLAVHPKDVRTSFSNLADTLARKAILAESDFTKKNMTVDIDDSNPKRLNTKFPVKLSGNVEVFSTDVYFGFYLGGN